MNRLRAARWGRHHGCVGDLAALVSRAGARHGAGLGHDEQRVFVGAAELRAHQSGSGARLVQRRRAPSAARATVKAASAAHAAEGERWGVDPTAQPESSPPPAVLQRPEVGSHA